MRFLIPGPLGKVLEGKQLIQLQNTCWTNPIVVSVSSSPVLVTLQQPSSVLGHEATKIHNAFSIGPCVNVFSVYNTCMYLYIYSLYDVL